MQRTAFMSFLANAQRQTYAAQGDDATVIPFLPASRQLEYSVPTQCKQPRRQPLAAAD
jgi:hypothetical protein